MARTPALPEAARCRGAFCPLAPFKISSVNGREAQIAAMSGRHPVVKGCFEAVVNASGAVMSTAC